MGIRTPRGLTLGAVALALAGAAPASAATFTVSGFSDSVGACAGTVCPSLRAAVSAANSAAGVDEIALQAGSFLISLGSDTAEDANASGDLDVTGSLTIRGAGAGATTIQGALPTDQGERDIHVPGNPNLTLSDLSVAGGRSGENESNGIGGGVYAQGAGTLTLERVVVQHNQATGKASSGSGGGIAAHAGARLVMRDSAVLNNRGFSFGYGGGIYIHSTSAGADLSNVTIAGNSASQRGGGIEAFETGPVTLTFVTVTGNEALGPDGGGGIGYATAVRLRNSIVTGNSAPGSTSNCAFATASDGGNVADPACGLNQPSDAATLDAMLAPLGGSPIPVLEPLAGSPALDRAVAPCPAADARGVARPQGAGCDAGAAERPVTPVAPVAPVISGAAQSRRTWRRGTKLATFSQRRRRPPVGTTFSFGLDQAAQVSLAFTQRRRGRRVNGRCVRQRPGNRRRRACRRTVTAGRLSFAGHPGTNTVTFQGRLSRRKKLKPGRYTLLITATNSAAQTSSAAPLRFRIVRQRR